MVVIRIKTLKTNKIKYVGFDRAVSESFEQTNIVSPLSLWVLYPDSTNQSQKFQGKKAHKVQKKQNLNLS